MPPTNQPVSLTRNRFMVDGETIKGGALFMGPVEAGKAELTTTQLRSEAPEQG
jgi:hypothetical protein